MAAWVARSIASGTTANGTNSHTCTFTAASSGNLLIAIVAGAVTSSTPSGWSVIQSAINFNGLYAFSKTATASESSFSTTHNASDYGIQAMVYEFYTGSAMVGTAGTATGLGKGSTQLGPTASSLTGTYTRFAVRCWTIPTAGTTASCSWTTPSVEDLDSLLLPAGSGDGVYLTIAYDDGQTGSSFQVESILDTSAGGSGEGLAFALSATTPPPPATDVAVAWLTA